MISRTPEQQRLYDARLKFQRDEAARLEFARNQGRDQALREGEDKGRVEGRVVLLQELLGVSVPTSAELANYDLQQLAELADQLQRQLRHRGQ